MVVVGLGCAGASAAVAASERGLDVLALERQGAPGGTSAMSGGSDLSRRRHPRAAGMRLRRRRRHDARVPARGDRAARCGRRLATAPTSSGCGSTATSRSRTSTGCSDHGVPFRAAFCDEPNRESRRRQRSRVLRRRGQPAVLRHRPARAARSQAAIHRQRGQLLDAMPRRGRRRDRHAGRGRRARRSADRRRRRCGRRRGGAPRQRDAPRACPPGCGARDRRVRVQRSDAARVLPRRDAARSRVAHRDRRRRRPRDPARSRRRRRAAASRRVRVRAAARAAASTVPGDPRRPRRAAGS